MSWFETRFPHPHLPGNRDEIPYFFPVILRSLLTPILCVQLIREKLFFAYATAGDWNDCMGVTVLKSVGAATLQLRQYRIFAESLKKGCFMLEQLSIGSVSVAFWLPCKAEVLMNYWQYCLNCRHLPKKVEYSMCHLSSGPLVMSWNWGWEWLHQVGLTLLEKKLEYWHWQGQFCELKDCLSSPTRI